MLLTSLTLLAFQLAPVLTTVEVHPTPIFGVPRLIGMAGAYTAVGEGISGLYINPAAVAMLPGGHPRDELDFDGFFSFNFDLSKDINNDGRSTPTERDQLTLSAGLSLSLWRLTIATGFLGSMNEVDDGSGTLSSFPMTMASGEIFLGAGMDLPWADVSLSGGLRYGGFSLTEEDDSEQEDSEYQAGGTTSGSTEGNSVSIDTRYNEGIITRFEHFGLSYSAGLLWHPHFSRFRVGLSHFARLFKQTELKSCTSACLSLEGLERSELPSVSRAGVAYRFGLSNWNVPVTLKRETEVPSSAVEPSKKDFLVFRDEFSVILAFDFRYTEVRRKTVSLDAFVNGEELPIASRRNYSLHFGGEVEVIPAWLRVQAGTYIEESRTETRARRLHGTLGAEVRLYDFGLAWWDSETLRPTFSTALDAALDYFTWTVSVGFWK